MPVQSPDDLPQSPGPGRLRHEIRIIKTPDAFKAMRRDWDALAAVAEEYSLCATYQYCELAASLVLAKGGIIAVVMVYDDRDLQAIWPFVIHREGPLRVANALSCGSDEEYGGPLVRGEANKAIFAAAVDAVMQVRADALEVRWVRDGSLLQESLESAPQSWLLPLLPKRLRGLPGYSIRLRGFPQWDDFAATLSKKLRANLRRGLKRLSAKGHAELGWCITIEDNDAVLTWLFANKRCWAKARGFDTQYLMDDRVRDFYAALARRIDLPATPLVAFVKLDGVPVAAAVNLVGPRSVEYFITTYDEAFGAYSVGGLMMDFIVKWAHANGRDFDFRYHYNDYKDRWANRVSFHQTRILFLTARGRIAEFSLLADKIARVGRKLRKTTLDSLETVKARIGRSLIPSRSRE